ncbi:MAG: respiratory nitrate reductase subunit gamma [Planctomycetota bacterium]
MALSFLLYAALALFLGGVFRRVGLWMGTPQRTSVVLTPAPTTKAGVLARVAANIAFFPALLRGDRVLWALGGLFHLALALLIVGHVSGIALAGEHFTLLGATREQSVAWSRAIGLGVGWAFSLALAGLFVRRVASPRVRAITGIPSYAILILIGAICTTGMLLRTLHVDLAAVRTFVVEVVTFRLRRLPVDAGGNLLLIHFSLVMALLSVFPHSRLLHACGVLVSPTLAAAGLARGSAGEKEGRA